MVKPYPGPHSIVIMDNMGTHRRIEKELQIKISNRGGVLLWGPPQSPDLNPIEKLWDVCVSLLRRRSVNRAVSNRSLLLQDLISVIETARLTRKSLVECGILEREQ